MWLKGATRHIGSWWTDWAEWTTARAGDQRDTPTRSAAPGTRRSILPRAVRPRALRTRSRREHDDFPDDGSHSAPAEHAYLASGPIASGSTRGTGHRCCSSWASAAISRCGTRCGPCCPTGSSSLRHAGTGGSSTPPLPLTIPDHAAVAGRLLATSATTVDVLGVSWGGVVAQQLAIAHAAGSGAWSSRPPSRRDRSRAGPGSWPDDDARRYYSPSYFEAVAPTSTAGGPVGTRPTCTAMPLRLARPPSLRGYLGQILAISTYTTLPFLYRSRRRRSS